MWKQRALIEILSVAFSVAGLAAHSWVRFYVEGVAGVGFLPINGFLCHEFIGSDEIVLPYLIAGQSLSMEHLQ